MAASLFVSAGLVFVFDQASKVIALSLDNRRQSGGVVRLARGRVALGLVQHRSALVLLWAAAVCGVLLVSAEGAPFGDWWARLGLGAALGGASGNLVDMLRRSAVVDFIDLRVWPVFNFADAAIVMGAAVAISRLA